MPYVRIERTDGATYEQKLQIYKETTEMLVRILNKKPDSLERVLARRVVLAQPSQ